MTERRQELAETLHRRSINICYLQKLKWRGSQFREISYYHHLLYNGTSPMRNGVGINLEENMKKRIIKVERTSDRIIYGISNSERKIIADDLNGHVGEKAPKSMHLYVNFGYSSINKALRSQLVAEKHISIMQDVYTNAATQVILSTGRSRFETRYGYASAYRTHTDKLQFDRLYKGILLLHARRAAAATLATRAGRR
ncbi:hypothetical protein EVAR_74309_1 [Eumeta japonica]|uniref:Uncharacterized protein n=1 Tax=Eumeta variegata TaxID=151549 RepID=A0A4C1SF03_EUMVA|nr:hypothetical protein EVAR_74309_1 [Eumeta japonica]